MPDPIDSKSKVIGHRRDVLLLQKPESYLADYFVHTPLSFRGSTTELESAR